MRETIKHGIAGAIVMLKKIKTLLTIVVFILLLYAIISIASIGRFEPTHAITAKSSCVNCHIDAVVDLNSSKHIWSHIINVGANQSMTIGYYLNMANSTDVNGVCMSCHNGRRKYFGVVDPYIYNFSGNNISVINGIVFWDSNTNVTNSEPNETITVNARVQDVAPANTSVVVDVTVQLMNFSGAQNSSNISRVCICNDTDMTIVISNAYADYFKVYIDMSGAWDFASLNVTINGYPSATINAFNGSTTNFYNLPVDLYSQYSGLNIFHTLGNYTVQRMDMAISDMTNASVVSISTNEIMGDYIGNTSSYTCGTPSAMCHINSKITYLGQTFGLKNGRYYAHEMEYATTKTCKTCHI